MRVVVCGSRHYKDRDAIAARLRTLVNAHAPVLVITGGARGADTITHNVAPELADEGLGVETKVIDADWSVKDDTPFWAIRTTRNGRRYDLRAGNLRNGLMLDQGPELVIAFADDLADAHGTADCSKQARSRKIATELHTRDAWNARRALTPRCSRRARVRCRTSSSAS